MTAAAPERVRRLAELPFEPAGAVSNSHLGGFLRSLGDIWQRHELLGLLVRRELKSRYKDSSLGFMWTLIRPLVMLFVYYFVVGKVLGAERAIPQYAIFVFAGLTIWGYFNEIIVSGTASILTNAGLIKKVYLPREIFPIAATGSAMVNFGAQLVVLFVATIVLRQFPWHLSLLYGLAAAVIVTIYATALAMLLAAVNVYLRDVQYLVEVSLLVLMWASPIVYSLAFVRAAIAQSGVGVWLDAVYLSNPVTIAVLAFQKAFWIAGTPQVGTVYPAHFEYWIAGDLVVAIILFWIAQRVFTRLQGNFAQEI